MPCLLNWKMAIQTMLLQKSTYVVWNTIQKTEDYFKSFLETTKEPNLSTAHGPSMVATAEGAIEGEETEDTLSKEE
jgi:hypothetical protein